MTLGELEDVVVVRPAEPVDRLGVVADGREVARPGRRERLDQGHLDGVGILHLVDQEVAEQSPLHRALVGELAEQPGPLEEQVVVVHAVGGALALGISGRDRLDLRSPLGQLGVPLGGDLGHGPVDVGAKLIRCCTSAGLGAIFVVPASPASSMARRIRSSWSSPSRIVKFGR